MVSATAPAVTRLPWWNVRPSRGLALRMIGTTYPIPSAAGGDLVPGDGVDVGLSDRLGRAREAPASRIAPLHREEPGRAQASERPADDDAAGLGMGRDLRRGARATEAADHVAEAVRGEGCPDAALRGRLRWGDERGCAR